MDIHPLLDMMRKSRASDLHLKAGSPPLMRIDGDLHRVPDYDILKPPDLNALAAQIASRAIRDQLDSVTSADFSYAVPGVARFRVNLFRQRGSLSMVMRIVRFEVPPMDRLGVPDVVKTLCDTKNGLVLVTGATGSGKSTTLASIIDYINDQRRCHVVTIEDPIEYIHYDRQAVINQREITIDTQDFSTALRSVMRQDPDVILIGEMRDIETFQAAISASETGHLVFSTLHTTNAMQTVDRIIDLFPSTQHDQVRSQLSINLRAMMCMRLLPRKDGIGRVPICEVMFNTPAVRKLIKENRVAQITLAIQQGREAGMQTFNDSLHDLVRRNLVSLDVALEASDNPEELQMMLQGIRLSSTRGGILGA